MTQSHLYWLPCQFQLKHRNAGVWLKVQRCRRCTERQQHTSLVIQSGEYTTEHGAENKAHGRPWFYADSVDPTAVPETIQAHEYIPFLLISQLSSPWCTLQLAASMSRADALPHRYVRLSM